MEKRWNLDALYGGFSSREFLKDCKTIDSETDGYEFWVNALPSKEGNLTEILTKYLKTRERIAALLERLLRFAELSFSADTKNQEAALFMEVIGAKQERANTIDVKFVKRLGGWNINFADFKDKFLLDHKFHFLELVEKGRHMLDENSERLVSDMKSVGSAAWMNLHNLLTSSLMVEIENEKGEIELKPITHVRNLAYSADAKTRKRAYMAELAAYPKIEKSIAACINGVKGESLILSRFRGYESPLQMTLAKNRMEKRTLDVMMEAIKKYLPIFKAYYKKKASLLGHSGGLPFYDFFAPVVKSDSMSFTYEQAADFIVEKFGSFSKKLGNFAKKVFDSGWIDAEIRENKVGGGFCQNLFSISQSRILTNFNGSYNDLRTIAHELGHAFHGYSLSKMGLLNSVYPTPLAETASIFCETIVNNAALKEVDKDLQLAILEADISSSGQAIVDIYSRYLFETSLFSKRRLGSLSSEQLKEEMITAQKAAYGEGIDQKYLHPYLWLIKPHYYNPEWNYYNFPYAFGLLFAKGLYAIYLEKGEEFVEKYETLLSETGRNSVTDVGKLVGVDLNDINFWTNSLELIKADVLSFIKNVS